jgi:protease I
MRVAFLVANEGVEQVDWSSPGTWSRCRCSPDLLASKCGVVQAFHHRDRGVTFPVDATTEEASADDYDALVLPGGVVNADAIRLDHHAVRFVRQCFEANKP